MKWKEDYSSDIPSTLSDVVDFLKVAMPIERLKISTIGPEGTSASFVGETLKEAAHPELDIDLLLAADFNSAMTSVLMKHSDFALVPSAYRDATAFHWNSELVLEGCFVHHTPAYGLATKDGKLSEDSVILATMDEVESLFAQLATPEVQARLADVIPAKSTSHAASLVGEGRATVAVCNEIGVYQNNLQWFKVREGVPRVWLVFAHK